MDEQGIVISGRAAVIGGSQIDKQMRDIILDMMYGLRFEGCPTREYCLLKEGQLRWDGRLIFYERAFDDLRGIFEIMAARGWVDSLVSGAEPVYRITDEFAAYLLDGWPERRWPEWSLSPEWLR